MEKTHWLIRVNDGINFENSIYNFWGVKSGRNDFQKTMVKKIAPGDILWFITNKKFGGKAIGMAEYTCFYDRREEPLLQINTYSNKDQGWIGCDDWDIQIHYINLYLISKQNIKICVQCAGNILNYDTFAEKKQIDEDLRNHYQNFKFYSEIKSKNLFKSLFKNK